MDGGTWHLLLKQIRIFPVYGPIRAHKQRPGYGWCDCPASTGEKSLTAFPRVQAQSCHTAGSLEKCSTACGGVPPALRWLCEPVLGYRPNRILIEPRSNLD